MEVNQAARRTVRNAVSLVQPFDTLESLHRQDALDWVDGGNPLFRIKKPDKPPKHLVSYFVLYDEQRGLLLLIDHIKASLWLPPGGHVDPNENPRETVAREAKEELAIEADFTTKFGDRPLFITVTTTRGSGTHVDVSLWYVIKGDSTTRLWYDPREIRSYQWLSFEQIKAMDIDRLDPHLHRFVGKMQSSLSES